VSFPALPLFFAVAGRPVILLGSGEAAAAKRRLLTRAGAQILGEDAEASLAIVALDDESEALAAIARLKERGVLVNAVDRPEHCDFTLPAIVDRNPVVVAIGTGGVSAGLAAALRQRLEALLPATIGALAEALFAARGAIRDEYPDAAARRRALAQALGPGGYLDPLGADPQVGLWLSVNRQHDEEPPALVRIALTSSDPDDLTLRQARALAQADRVYHAATIPSAILDRARADAIRIVSDASPVTREPGLTIWMEWA
jgi:uroporphyrin-III C-methyltransferase/precorrin-2 dehydrogenase/sirohydrochlorin ferrochelatase